ncbi:MAG: chlorophyll synthase ChlG [Rhodobacteraceae bacterium]|nr:MAG: chlorophyll synthase ChlG [Paracoccaceae bacterium]
MSVMDHAPPPSSPPQPAAVLELLKPITWFPPMWAFMCGAVSSGQFHWGLFLAGIILAGPLVCGMSQAANDWCDRHVDAINEPNRPIPSGRIPGRWGLWIALIWTAVSLLVGYALGSWVFWATVVAVAAAWAYSAEPIRLKKDARISALVCGLSYETLPWFTGAAVMLGAFPDWRIVLVALLYGLGAHGIMTLNDFKAVEGDRAFGLATLPATLGPDRAARMAVATMFAPQVVVILLILLWGKPWQALIVAALLAGQAALVPKFFADPTRNAVFFSGFGVLLYVLGMLTTACVLHLIVPGAA